MSLHEKLRPYLADKHATFSREGVSWTDAEGAHLLIVVDGPLSAAHIIDGHVLASARGARLHLAYEGAVNPVAQRTAARFEAVLLSADELPSPRADDAMPWHTAPSAPVEEQPTPTLPVFADAMPWHAPVAPSPPTDLVLANSEPAPEIAHADDAMPWGGEVRGPEKAELVAVDPIEMLAVPWIHEMEDGVEELPAGRETRAGPAFRPTQAPSWGLPWPRPPSPADGLAIADPKIWNTGGRLTQMREDLDRIGAPSFGAAKPEGSAWLKRVSEFGPL